MTKTYLGEAVHSWDTGEEGLRVKFEQSHTRIHEDALENRTGDIRRLVSGTYQTPKRAA